ncbi:MAG: hypothetical protein QNK36_00325 [Colwellia sp.]|nr:hypothetical protein [Colwellia sp.]
MTNNNFQENHQQLAQQLFCAKSAYISLTQGTGHGSQYGSRYDNNEDNFTVVFNDIFQLVKGNSQKNFVARRQQLIKKINTDLSLRKTYIQLIEQLKFAQSGLQVAASSGEALPERVTEYFSLKFKRDKSHPTQVYVILSINHPAEQHLTNTFAVHISNNDQIDCLYFPSISDGRSQLLMEDNDNSFKLLTDPNSRLYLM